jgi:hypothetical protein
MECPKCEADARVIDTKSYRHNPGEPLTQVRVYACTNWDCLHAFTYRNTYLGEAERRDAAKFLRRIEKQLEDQQSGQQTLELEED